MWEKNHFSSVTFVYFRASHTECYSSTNGIIVSAPVGFSALRVAPFLRGPALAPSMQAEEGAERAPLKPSNHQLAKQWVFDPALVFVIPEREGEREGERERERERGRMRGVNNIQCRSCAATAECAYMFIPAYICRYISMRFSYMLYPPISVVQ